MGLLVFSTLSASGCSLCCSPYNDDYVTFGSRTPRIDMKKGRVGSILSDQQAMSTQQAELVGKEIEEPQYEIDSTVNENEEVVSIGQRRSESVKHFRQ